MSCRLAPPTFQLLIDSLLLSIERRLEGKAHEDAGLLPVVLCVLLLQKKKCRFLPNYWTDTYRKYIAVIGVPVTTLFCSRRELQKDGDRF
ncbi:hypothetical protein GDO78_002314 [Eleutherodactylus coqui]|uniref:Uncharacterized protein n=1 Tax=Eleutherodactylus coqui TaxID=57060 RepID=A0A8J6K2F7_ELECQ|nr:hypothetical protein GDO78_002314 [Eleutherodactylus coqui]